MQRRLASLILVACGHQNPEAAPAAGTAKLAVTSPAFAANAEIPTEHTCEGGDTAPPLAWSGAPAATKSFALIVDDPDAPDPAKPQRTWVHWVVARIPATTTTLADSRSRATPGRGLDGKNDWGTVGWRGPCPPIGRHRYFFKVYALDAEIGEAGMTKAELLEAIKGHVVGQGEIVGTYQKKR